MRVRIKPSEEDVRQGMPDCFTCPLAREVNRHLKPGFVGAVFPTALEIYRSDRPIRSDTLFRSVRKSKRPVRVCSIDLPREAIQFIRRFDGAIQVEDRKRTKPPAAFTIVIPSKYVRKGGKKSKTQKPKKNWWD